MLCNVKGKGTHVILALLLQRKDQTDGEALQSPSKLRFTGSPSHNATRFCRKPKERASSEGGSPLHSLSSNNVRYVRLRYHVGFCQLGTVSLCVSGSVFAMSFYLINPTLGKNMSLSSGVLVSYLILDQMVLNARF